MRRQISRREFLVASSATVAGGLLVACGSGAPTEEPTAPAEEAVAEESAEASSEEAAEEAEASDDEGEAKEEA